MKDSNADPSAGHAREPVDLAKLLRIAEATVFETVSPSAKSNLTDQIAADAVEQYLLAVDAGQEIRNPYGWIKVTARRRALDAVDAWERHKKATIAVDDESSGTNDYVSFAIRSSVLRAIESDNADPGSLVVEREWLREVISRAYPDSRQNREIAIACLVEGARPREVATEFGMTPKALGNRLVRIRQRLRDEVGASTS